MENEIKNKNKNIKQKQTKQTNEQNKSINNDYLLTSLFSIAEEEQEIVVQYRHWA